MTRITAVLACLLFSACAQVHEEPRRPAAETRSGARLRARWGSAGAIRQFLNFRDTARDEDCSVVSAAKGGAMRCMPLSSTAANLYGDAACTKPAAVASECSEQQPKILVTQAQDAFYDVVGTTTTAYQRTSDGACVPASRDLGSFFVVGGEPRSTNAFVSFHERDIDVGHRLHAIVLDGDDGSRVLTATFFDSKLRIKCFFERTTDGTERCVPIAHEDALWDPTCTKPFLYSGSQSDYFRVRDASCGYAFFRAGEVFVDACATRNGDACRPEKEPCKLRALTPVDPSEFAGADYDFVGDLRLEQRMRVIGSARFDAGITDRERDESCVLTGIGRCMPVASYSPILSSESSCTPMFAVKTEWDRCHGYEYAAFRSGCGSLERRHLDEPVATPATLYTIDSSDRCVERPAAELTRGLSLYRLGAPVPEGAFARTLVFVE